MSAVKYDLVVIGSGPAGQRAAVAAAKMGKRVAVVEARQVVGGVCINTGTIPSKTMREAVLHLSGYNYRSVYGVNYRVKEKITMADLAFRVQAVIKTEVDVTEAQLSRNGIDVVHGIASFIDPHHVRVEGVQTDATLEADRIIIAVGTKPAVSDKVPVNGKSIVNSDQILGLECLPRTLIVVGGGVVGVEYACMFAVLGVRVTLIEKRSRLLEFADQEIIEALSYHLRDMRVTMRLGEEVESVEEPTPHPATKTRRWDPEHGRGQPAEQEKGFRRRTAVCGGPTGKRGRPEPGCRRPRSRQARPHRRGRALPDQGGAYLCRGRRGGLSVAGLGFDGAGTHRRCARVQRPCGVFQSQLLSVRHLYDSRRSASSAKPRSS